MSEAQTAKGTATFSHGTLTGYGMLNSSGHATNDYVNSLTGSGIKTTYVNKVSEDLQLLINYKYAEDRIIADFHKYIDKTYSQHYKTKEESLQCFDAWLALGDATPTFRNTAIKYLWRYGKKNGNNKDDLMKVLHYTLMCLYNDHYKK